MRRMEGPEEHRALVGRLFKTLAPIVSFERVGDGWTSDTYRVNGDWIVQLARSDRAAETLRTQMDVLPELAREVSAPVPVPELVSRDPAAMAYRRIDGAAATDASGVWPERLGRFLYDLHMVRPEFVGMRARGSEVIRAALEAELTTVTQHVFPLLTVDERNRLGGRLGTAITDERTWRFAPCVTHNDLVAAHVLVNDEGDLAGVIDWEEVAMGDPAADFAWVLGEEPESGERALAAYGGAPDDRFRERCWFYFMIMPWRDVTFGLESGDDEPVERSLAMLRERGQIL
jgi:aminoglycoside phosphotransferase (APT) family kinase protein